MEFTYSTDVKVGKKVKLRGWIDQIRDIGNLKFFKLRDREGLIQVTLKKGETPDELLKLVEDFHREDCVIVEGVVKSSKIAIGGKEIFPDKIEVVNRAETPLPIETKKMINTSVDKRFDYRFIDIRDRNIQAVFRVKDKVLSSMREFFEKEGGFIEVQTPVIQAAGAEGGATLFPVKYYKENAFLRQSPQLYKQMLMASGLDKVYEIGPAFRAEKFHTRRHVSEFISVDFEMAWIDSVEDVMKVVERMAAYAVKKTLKECKRELEILGVKDVKVPELPFKRITYSDGVDILNKMGKSFEWGDDMTDVEERIIGDYMMKKGHEWYFVTRFPSKLKPFYIMMDGKESHSYDCIYRGMEMASGGQREHRYDVLVKVMKEKGLNPKNFKFYLDAFRWGMPPHGGMGFGVERMVQQMLKLENIKEAILFPRTPERLVP